MKLSESIFEKINPKSVHFIGIGGIGVSSLAYWFRAGGPERSRRTQKWTVSGSDSAEGKITLDLKKDRFRVKIGHKKGLLGLKTGLVIYSNAVKPDNPELREARRLGIPTLSYPETIGVLTRHYRTFGVAGAHGKSTTTSLLSLVLIKAGWDPTVIVGTKLKEFGLPAGRQGGKNFRLGKSDYLVLESDEWSGAFWNYSPFGTIITNIDREHLDFYENFGNVKKSFLKYIGNIQLGGILVANRDDKNLLSLKCDIEKITKRNGVELVWYSVHKNPKLSARIKNNLSVPGRHNVSNAMGAYVLARNLGIPEKKILSALKDYRGAWRRMEYRGEIKIQNSKIKVYDDYAHHPTEIKATLEAFREKFPKSAGWRIICVFQPHQAHRLKALFNDFAHAFNDAGELILLPSYKVAGRDKLDERYTSEMLAKKIPGAIYLKNPRNLRRVLEKIVAGSGPKARNSKFEARSSKLHATSYKLQTTRFALVMMGAGTIAEYTDELLRRSR